jgi:hypothetical protein
MNARIKVALAAVSFTGLLAAAPTTVYVRDNSAVQGDTPWAFGSLVTGQTNLSNSSNVGFGAFALQFSENNANPWTSFITYCLDPDQSLRPFDTSYGVVTSTNYSPAGNYISQLWGLFYGQSIAANPVINGTSYTTAQASAAFQLALWELTRENGSPGNWDVNSGNFKVLHISDSNAATLANYMLAQLTATGTGPQLWMFTSGTRQDLVFLPPPGDDPVPEPSTLAMLSGGLLGLGLIRRRTRKV